MAHHWRWTLLPILVALALFAHAVPDAGFIADDTFNLSEHARHGDIAGEWTTPTYAHAGGERGHIWRPIPASIQHIAAIGFGRSGSVFRALNLLVHLVNVWLVMLVARTWGAHFKTAALAGLIWTTHSSMPEAVCWNSDIYDLLATTVMLGGLTLIGQKPTVFYWPALALIALIGCLCKESGLALIPAFCILIAHRHGGRNGLKAAAALGLGGGVYWMWHRHITAQGYVDALVDGTATSILDAWLMAVGWIAYAPSRAPMAHLFDRIADAHEVWIGVGVVLLLCMCAADQYRRRPEQRVFALALVCTGILLIPAAVGIPFIGVAPLRYIYMPFALLVAMGACTWASEPNRNWVVGLLFICTLGSTRILARVPAFHSDITLWSAELKAEPNNPYAAGSLARALIATGKPNEGIKVWAHAIENAPDGIRVFDRANERWLLAQTAFMKRRPGIALREVNKLINESNQKEQALPPMAHCLRADSLDALGRTVEASAAGRLCRY